MSKYLILAFTVLSLLFTCCDKNDEPKDLPPPSGILLSIADKEGNDLLDSTFKDNVLESFKYAVVWNTNPNDIEASVHFRYFDKRFVVKDSKIRFPQSTYEAKDSCYYFLCYIDFITDRNAKSVYSTTHKFQIIATYGNSDVRIYDIVNTYSPEQVCHSGHNFRFEVDGVRMKNDNEIVLIR